MSTANLSRVLDWARYRLADRDALLFEDRRWTYAELDRDVNALAAGLLEQGVAPDERIAILALNRPEYLLLALAIAKVGAVMVPLNYRLHEEELAYLLEHSGVVGIASEEDFAGVASRLADRLAAIRVRLALDGAIDTWVSVPDLVSGRAGARVPDAERDAGDLQRILYTSGTTSRPKGARITHGNCNANMAAQVAELELSRETRLLVFAPLYHVGGLDVPGYSVWYAGGTIVLLRRFDVETVLETIERERITGMGMVATMVHQIRALPHRARYDTSSVRWMIFSQVTPSLFHETRNAFPNAQLIEGYGLTETCNGLTYLDMAHMLTKQGSAGRPLHGVDVRVVDESDREVPAGTPGEIVVRGPKVCDGYLDDAEATARAFRGGWLHTGDVGRFDEDGYLYILDRLKDMIRSGGENVAGPEIEAVVYEVEGVHEAAAIGISHPRWVEVPAIFVVAAEGVELDAEAIVAHCRSRLAGFKIPKAVYLVDELPRNPSGKVLKRELREQVPRLIPAWAAER